MVGMVAMLLGIAAFGVMLVLPVVLLNRFDPTRDRHSDSGRRRRRAKSGTKKPDRHDTQAELVDGQAVRPRPARGEPIGPLSADLRRLRIRIRNIDRLPAVHQIALYKAYDQALTDMCEMLEVEHEINQHNSVIERDLERLRVEAELEGRGIVLSLPGAQHRHTR